MTNVMSDVDVAPINMMLGLIMRRGVMLIQSMMPLYVAGGDSGLIALVFQVLWMVLLMRALRLMGASETVRFRQQ